MNYFNGVIDQVRVFSKAISSTEVTTLYNETYSSTSKSVTDIFGDRSALALYQFENSVNDTGGASGYYGAGAIFNGSSSHIDIPSPIPYTNTDFSFTGWLYLNSSFGSGFQTIIGAGDKTTGEGIFRILIRYSSSNNYTIEPLRAFSGNSYYAATSDYSAQTINEKTWFHLVFTYTASSKSANVYLNGSSISSTNLTNTSTDATNSGVLALGQYRDSSSGYWDGKMDEIRIYSDVLTSTEVGHIYNNTTASIPTDNLEAYFKFEGNAQDEQQQYDATSTDVIYRYDGSGNDISFQGSTNFRPDFTWTKMLGSNNHQLFDSVRGVNKELESNTTAEEVTNSNSLTVFNSNGFTVGSSNNENQSGTEYISWNWRSGGAPTASNTNSSGAMTSNSVSLNGTLQSSYTPSGSPSIYPTKMSINTTSGFSIVSYTGNGSAGATIPHGLSSAPNLIITKGTTGSAGVTNWNVYSSVTGATKKLVLNSTNGQSTNTTWWNDTAPTTNVFSLGTTGDSNYNTSNYIAYCFHNVTGFQKIDSFVGNDSTDGVIVETGFEVGWLLLKNTTTDGNSWAIIDNTRSVVNPRLDVLFPNSTDNTYTSTGGVNFLTNGFQVVSTDNFLNGSGDTMLYWAIAADPSTAATPTVTKSFDVVTYTGTGAAQNILSDIKADFAWIKSTSHSTSWEMHDTVRNEPSRISSDSSSSDPATANGFVEFIDGGFSLDSTGGGGEVNASGRTYQALLWSAGSHEGNLATANEQGSISSVTSVNDASGFSIVKYIGNGTNGATVGHGLSVKPEWIFIKNLDDSFGWIVYDTNVNSVGYLHLTDAFDTSRLSWGFNSTAPTSTVVTLGYNGQAAVNGDGKAYIMYCFSSISQHSAVGSYTGQTSGVTVTTGFRPRLIIVKSTSNVENWVVLTTDLGSGNALKANTNSDNDESSRNTFTVSDTGFSFPHQSTADAALNENNYTYIYYAVK